MDINYLLLLQEFRAAIQDGLTPFMEKVSFFSIYYLLIIPAFVYWCVDKSAGVYTFAAYNAGNAINSAVKLTVCAPRPWIRDPRIVPAGDSINTATGYSFPSGHTVTAGTLYGGLAVSAWKKIRWISVLCIILILLTGFSRNYLGVHTPQDVLVGLAESLLMLWGVSIVFRYVAKHPEKESCILTTGIVIGILMLVYFTIKSYPVIENVNPEKMKKDGYGDIGRWIAFCLGRMIEQKWIRFKPELSKSNLAVGLTGAVIVYFMLETLWPPMIFMFGDHWGTFSANMAVFLFIMAGWPAILKITQNKGSGAY
ncbi:MAG: phosphatase PAP2 family protein [Lachnospiraceae bacterium]|nr:phosphatase PAP2 family protein [Lachnospiraceae bacterium]